METIVYFATNDPDVAIEVAPPEQGEDLVGRAVPAPSSLLPNLVAKAATTRIARAAAKENELRLSRPDRIEVRFRD